MLEAGVEMWFKTKVHHNRIMMAVDMGVNTVQALEDLTQKARKTFGEWDACGNQIESAMSLEMNREIVG